MPLTSPTLETSPTLLTEAGESTPATAVTPLGLRGMQVLVGGRDLTSRCDSLVFSAVDNGGFEICTLGLPSADRPLKGTPVIIRQGLSVAWMGRVAELADHSSHAHATKTVGCEGHQAVLKDTQLQMLYVDRDLSQWKPPSVQRLIDLTSVHQRQGSFTVGTDARTNSPALVQELADDWEKPWVPIVESWYDAGPGNLIAYLYLALTCSVEAAESWGEVALTCADDVGTGFAGSGNLHPTTTEYFIPQLAQRFAFLQHYFATSPGGSPGGKYLANWRLAVYGNHGLPGRGAAPVGFYPSDIARHALSQVGGISAGVIEDSVGYIAPHVVYRTPTNVDTVINDMAKLMGWTWGVWGPATAFGDAPRLDFRAPPTDATCVVSKAECDELDITSRLGDLYDTCVVSYTDGAGTLGQVTVRLPNAQLYEAGITDRTLQLAAGMSTEAAAGELGLAALLLSQIAARGAGQVTLPSSVRLLGGGSKPSALLRPGSDRLRITDLIDGGPLLEQGTSRRDVFRISRVETTVGKDGVASTRAELDNGVNLLETLQARLALAAGVVGAGAG